MQEFLTNSKHDAAGRKAPPEQKGRKTMNGTMHAGTTTPEVTVTQSQMIAYLQSMLDRVTNDKWYSDEDKHEFIHEMIACKEMVEALIGMPVNLGLNGKVTVGF